MSFLPYQQAPAATWFTAVGGSSVLHAGLAASLLLSSVTFLPPPSTATLRASEFEVTLEILDMEIVDEASLVPPDAVPLSPESTPLTGPDSPELAALTPEDPSETLMVPDLAPDTPADLVEDPVETLPDAPETQELTAAEAPVDAPELSLPEPVAAQPAPPTLDPETLAIDDISPIDESVINPLAQSVAAAPLEPLQPDAEIDTAIVAIALPDPETITLDPAPQAILPEPEAITPQAPADDPIENVALPEEVVPQIDTAPQEQTPATEEIPAATAAIPGTIANPSPGDQVIATLLQRIRAIPAPTCTLALPRRAGPEGVALSLISSEQGEQAVTQYQNRIADGLSPEPAVSVEGVDPRQCALLDTVRRIGGYPASRLGISIEDTTLSSGDTLRGAVTGAGGLNLILLLVDDNGAVQDLARFASAQSGGARFEAPVARAGPARDTRQIFLAIGDPSGAVDFAPFMGQDAQSAFAALPASDLSGLVFGLATFDVR